MNSPRRAPSRASGPRPWRRRLGASLALPLALALGTVVAQQPLPVHRRGSGELLPPQLRDGPAVGDAMADLTMPEYLWAFQRDTLLPPVAAAELPQPVVQRIARALVLASRSDDGELRWQSLWALARIARHDATIAASLRQRVLDDRLLDDAGTTGQVALVALGLAAHGDGKALAALQAVANAPAAGARRRAFAFYGLGLAAQESRDATVQFRVLAAVQRVLLQPKEVPAEVLVAALHALALLRIDVAPDLPAPALEALERAWSDAPPPGPIEFRAHVPIAVAALVDRDAEAAEAWRRRFAAVAVDDDAPTALRRSCVLALGALCRPWDDAASPDAAHGEVLQQVAAAAKSVQLRNFALFAMGCAGGERHRERLREALRGRFLVTPWAALGLAAACARGQADEATVAAVAAARAAMKHPAMARALQDALRSLRGEAPPDVAADFLERYGLPMPGGGNANATAEQLATTLADQAAPLDQRRLAALALGHLADRGPHWSARLARAIDYRSATPALLGAPNGVLRLP